MKYKLVRSNRKSLAIQVTKEGELIARAPKRMSVREIEAFINKKKHWIEKHQSRAKMQEQKKETLTLDYGTSVLFLGKAYMINGTATDRITLEHNRSLIHMPKGLTSEEIRQMMIDFYRNAAHLYLPERVSVFASKLNVYPAVVKVNGAKKRWGSCSGKGNINFSYRLMAASPDAVDYVVIHECCHLLEMNHSGRFWSHVSTLCPDYNEMKKILNAVSERLDVQNL